MSRRLHPVHPHRLLVSRATASRSSRSGSYLSPRFFQELSVCSAVPSRRANAASRTPYLLRWVWIDDPEITHASTYIVINHGGGVRTLHQHLAAKAIPAVGARVKSGQRIGTMGATGTVTVVHLHTEVTSTATPRILRPGTPNAESGSPQLTRALTSPEVSTCHNYQLSDQAIAGLPWANARPARSQRL